MRTQQDKTIRNMNLHLCATWECDDNWWPIIRPSYAIPERLATFELATAPRNGDAFCHFFMDDYRFERVWNRPERYVKPLRQYAGCIAPDFSMYTDMPYPMQMWNQYRSRMLTQYWQDNGIEVIPSFGWSDWRSLEFCCDGLPQGGTYAVGTVGCLRTEESTVDFARKLSECLDRVRPDTLLLYGHEVDLGIPSNIRTIWYGNDNHDRVVANAGHTDRKRGDHGKRRTEQRSNA